MGEVKWIKITTNIFDDEKIKLIDAMPDNDAILVIWFKILALAGKTNESGALLLNHKLAYTDEMLATIFGRKITTIRLALNTFEQLEMVEKGDYIQVINWEKHQNEDGLKRIREKNRERVQRFRDKKKVEVLENKEENKPNNDVTLHETLRNALDTSKSYSSSSSLSLYLERFNTFWKIYPKKVGKGKCEEWFKKNKPSEALTNTIINAVEDQKKSPQWIKEDGQFIPNPATWLNQKRWGDSLEVKIEEVKIPEVRRERDDIDYEAEMKQTLKEIKSLYKDKKEEVK